MRRLLSPQPWVVLAASLALTATATWLSNRAFRIHEETAFRRAITADVGRLRARLQNHGALLRAASAFIQTEARSLTPARFHDFVEHLEIGRNYPGVRGIGFNPIVHANDAAAFEERVRREGMDDYRVWPPGPREPMFPVRLLEPLNARNVRVLGFDMLSDPLRRQAMLRARDTGSYAVTAPLNLKSVGSAPGFLVFEPIYAGGVVPATLTERQASLVGFVYAGCATDDFFDKVFPQRAGLQVRVFSSSAEGQPLQLLYGALDGPINGGSLATRQLTLGGQPWTIEFSGHPTSALTFERWLPALCAAVGTLVSLLLFALVRQQSRAGAAAEAAAFRLSATLAMEKRQRDVAESLSGLALALAREPDAERLVQQVTDDATRLSGAAFGVFLHNADAGGSLERLSALAGTPRDAFLAFPPLRRTTLLARTLEGHTVRLDDVRESPLFDPDAADDSMPLGPLAVASYLGVPVRTQAGELFGGLFLGHPEPRRFTYEHEQLAEALAAQAALVLENAGLREAERRIHAETERQKALLDSVIEQSGEGIIVSDQDGVIRVFNHAATVQHGASHREVAAPDWARTYGLFTLDRQPLPLTQAPLYRALRGEVMESQLWCVRRPDGSWRTLTGTATPLRTASGEIVGAILVTHDDTERQAQQLERETLISALARSNKELDQFAYVASHDLKAPLRGIANLSQWIEEDLGTQLTPELARQFELLRNRAHRMEALIEGILLYSRAGRVAGSAEAIDCGALVREVLDLIAAPAQVRFVVSELPVVRAQRTMLQQVFMNLIGNAVKHAAGPQAEVRVDAQRDGDLWTFRISDNGPGISPEYHERIWGIFQTLEARDKVEGTGIGLSIVRKIVESAGGRAWVSSEPGHGATFLFTWPAITEADA